MPAPTVLIIANKYEAEMVRRTVEEAGLRAAVAEGGESAVEKYEQEAPSVVVVAMGLYYADGADVLREIREVETARVPILLIGDGDGEVTSLERAKALGADDLLLRPVDPVHLAARILQVAGDLDVDDEDMVEVTIERTEDDADMELVVERVISDDLDLEQPGLARLRRAGAPRRTATMSIVSPTAADLMGPPQLAAEDLPRRPAPPPPPPAARRTVDKMQIARVVLDEVEAISPPRPDDFILRADDAILDAAGMILPGVVSRQPSSGPSVTAAMAVAAPVPDPDQVLAALAITMERSNAATAETAPLGAQRAEPVKATFTPSHSPATAAAAARPALGRAVGPDEDALGDIDLDKLDVAPPKHLDLELGGDAPVGLPSLRAPDAPRPVPTPAPPLEQVSASTPLGRLVAGRQPTPLPPTSTTPPPPPVFQSHKTSAGAVTPRAVAAVPPAPAASDTTVTPVEPPLPHEELPESGQLGDGGPALPSLLGMLHRAGFTGRLTLRHGDGERAFFFDGGLPVHALSNLPHDSLGEMLWREGRIGREQYARAREQAGPGGVRRLGEVLVATGALRRDELGHAARRCVEELVYAAFAWERGSFRLGPELPATEDRVRVSAHPFALVVEGIRRKYGQDRLVELVGAPATLLRPRPSLARVVADAGLGPDERAAAAALGSGPLTVEALAAVADLGVPGAYTLAFALAQLGAVTLETVAASAAVAPVIGRNQANAKYDQISDGDYFTVLGIGRDATGYEIRRAWEQARHDFDPERFDDVARGELAPRLAEIAEVLDEAFKVLGDDRLRASYRANLQGPS